jgi:hypothetical protein
MRQDGAVKSFVPRPILLFVVLPVALAWYFEASLWPLLAAFVAWVAIVLWEAQQVSRRNGAKKGDKAAVAFVLFLYFGLPVGLASVVAASWAAIGLAYVIWFGLLGLWAAQGLMSRSVQNGEAVGWAFIGGMFLTMVAVPALTLLLRLLEVA